MAHTLILARWAAALRAPGCPVCRMAREAGRDFLVSVLREGKSHDRVYARLREAGGFCEEHTRYLERLAAARRGDRRSVARLYGWLLDDLRSGPDPQEGCPACEAATRYEGVSLGALRDLLDPSGGDPVLRAQFEGGEGLCREHFLRAALRLEDRAGLRRLVEAQARAWDRLSRDLAEYLRKHDYRFSHEGRSPEEETSWVRAVAAISGGPADGPAHGASDPG